MQTWTVAYSIYIFNNSPWTEINDETTGPPNHPNLSRSKDVENIWNHNIMTCRSIQRLSLPSKPDHWKPESKYVQIWKQGGPENTKARRRTARLFLKSCGVGNCAPHEIDVKSLLKHRAHWWYQGSRLQFITACCVSYVYILLVAISVNVINSIPSF